MRRTRKWTHREPGECRPPTFQSRRGDVDTARRPAIQARTSHRRQPTCRPRNLACRGNRPAIASNTKVHWGRRVMRATSRALSSSPHAIGPSFTHLESSTCTVGDRARLRLSGYVAFLLKSFLPRCGSRRFKARFHSGGSIACARKAVCRGITANSGDCPWAKYPMPCSPRGSACGQGGEGISLERGSVDQLGEQSRGIDIQGSRHFYEFHHVEAPLSGFKSANERMGPFQP